MAPAPFGGDENGPDSRPSRACWIAAEALKQPRHTCRVESDFNKRLRACLPAGKVAEALRGRQPFLERKDEALLATPGVLLSQEWLDDAPQHRLVRSALAAHGPREAHQAFK